MLPSEAGGVCVEEKERSTGHGGRLPAVDTLGVKGCVCFFLVYMYCMSCDPLGFSSPPCAAGNKRMLFRCGRDTTR